MAAGGAVVLSGCSARHTAGAVPHVATETLSAQDRAAEGRRIQKTLENPIIGETLVWPAGTVPAGWMPCRGQVLKISDYTFLFRVVGRSGGGDGKKTFMLPRANAMAKIIAVAGTYPGSRGPLQAALKARAVL